MRLMLVVVALAAMAGGQVFAQDQLDWLSGVWSERVPAKRKNAPPPGTLQVAVAGGTLRILENGAEGVDLRCPVDGSEARYKQALPQSTLIYTLECAIDGQSVEVTGQLMVAASADFPQREFEIRKRYALARDGSLLRQDQLWGIIPGIGRVPVSDTSTTYTRQP